MAAFCMDENVPPELSAAVRALGHDALTVQADGRASRGIDDPEVLARAIELGRAVITNDRRDYHRLHRSHPHHTGIITYTNDPDRSALGLSPWRACRRTEHFQQDSPQRAQRREERIQNQPFHCLPLRPPRPLR